MLASIGGAGVVLALAAPASATELLPAWTQRIEQLARQAAQAALGAQPHSRVDIELGRLDSRLQLAPCDQVDVYLPPGYRAWGRTRVGLRCEDGPVRWNVFVPLAVRVLAPAVQASVPLPAGTALTAEHLRVAEADWAAVSSPAFAEPEALIGRTLLRAVAAGGTLREGDLKKRQWFAIGDIVRVTAVGRGFTVAADGVALTPGIEGQTARVRTDGGRVVSGTPTAERRVEVAL